MNPANGAAGPFPSAARIRARRPAPREKALLPLGRRRWLPPPAVTCANGSQRSGSWRRRTARRNACPPLTRTQGPQDVASRTARVTGSRDDVDRWRCGAMAWAALLGKSWLCACRRFHKRPCLRGKLPLRRSRRRLNAWIRGINPAPRATRPPQEILCRQAAGFRQQGRLTPARADIPTKPAMFSRRLFPPAKLHNVAIAKGEYQANHAQKSKFFLRLAAADPFGCPRKIMPLETPGAVPSPNARRPGERLGAEGCNSPGDQRLHCRNSSTGSKSRQDCMADTPVLL
jgi:hypothetical protein